jgi:hypothetical protein
MKKHMVFLCLWIILLVFCGCNLYKGKNEKGEVQKEITGSWQIKEAKIDVSQQNYQLHISRDGSWIVKKGEEVINFGTYTKQGDKYIFNSDQNDGERFTATATTIITDVIQLKVILSDGSKMELGGSKTGIGSMKNIVLGDLIETKKCEQTEKDIKKISQALESYAVDYGEYPSDSFENLKAYLVPYYILELPPVDGWGNIWFYDAFYIKNEPQQQYRLISFGSDGKPSPAITDKTSSKAKSAHNYDIIILNGTFISRCGQEN